MFIKFILNKPYKHIIRGVIEMIDIQEKKKREIQIDRLKRQLPYKCQDCSLLEILNLEKGKVRCFYNVNGKCILKQESENMKKRKLREIRQEKSEKLEIVKNEKTTKKTMKKDKKQVIKCQEMRIVEEN